MDPSILTLDRGFLKCRTSFDWKDYGNIHTCVAMFLWTRYALLAMLLMVQYCQVIDGAMMLWHPHCIDMEALLHPTCGSEVTHLHILLAIEQVVADMQCQEWSIWQTKGGTSHSCCWVLPGSPDVVYKQHNTWILMKQVCSCMHQRTPISCPGSLWAILHAEMQWCCVSFLTQ